MSAFDKAVQFVLGIETDQLITDQGGLTKYGISGRAHPNVDIANLTEAQAVAIYRQEYWNACNCDQLNEPLAILVFDAAVNQGTPTAIRFLQRALKVQDDGHIGPLTLAAAAKAGSGTTAEVIAQRAHEYGLDPGFQKDGLGWCRRLGMCCVAALTD